MLGSFFSSSGSRLSGEEDNLIPIADVLEPVMEGGGAEGRRLLLIGKVRNAA